MSGEDKQSPHELVIIKRRGGGHGDGHHGGAWKIAFADFMTALMCFFLVMWLINATDKKTITQVATYFNPLRLNDRAPSTKGLHDPAPNDAKPDSPESKEESKKGTKSAKPKSATPPPPAAASNGKKAAASSAGAAEHGADAELLRDPYGVLERIVAADASPNSERRSLGVEKGTAGLPADTFDPSSAVRPDDEARKGQATAARRPKSEEVDGKPMAEQIAQSEKSHGDDAPGPGKNARIVDAKELELRIGKALSELGQNSLPGIEITDGKSEILISLTDKFDFGMFAVSSARPTSALIGVMERVAKVLAETSGSVTIRGHTDARKFRTADNDNWRLSMARAQMAHYMLVRGGLNEARIKRLEGYADHALKDTADPMASQNRRIEILIAKGDK